MSREFLQAGVFYVGLIASAAMMLFVLGAFGQL
jgi:xanthine/CO dehydrogenase XdhC/CoxF family maturation factor